MAAEGLAGEEQVLAILHVEHGVARQRVLGITGRLKDAHRVAALLARRGEVMQAAGAAAPVVEEVRIDVDHAPAVGAVRQRQVVLSPRPDDLVALPQHRLEVEVGPRVLELEIEVATSALASLRRGLDVGVPVALGAQQQTAARSRGRRRCQRVPHAQRQRVCHRSSIRRWFGARMQPLGLVHREGEAEHPGDHRGLRDRLEGDARDGEEPRQAPAATTAPR